MSIVTISISGNDYTSYASVDEADARLLVDPVRAATWALLTADQKGVNLVAATNRLDLLLWQGEKAGGATQENQWPRTGVKFCDGSPVPDTDVPLEVEDATILTAGSIALDPSFSQQGSAGSNISEVKAGSAGVKFFRPVTGGPLQDETALALLRCFLGTPGGSTLFGAASGTDGESSFCDPDQFGLDHGYP